MFLLVGIVALFASLLVGYTMHGGKVAALMQINEFIIIGGAGLASVVIGYSPKAAIGMFTSFLGLLKGNPYKKSAYLDLLQAMYQIFQLGRREGLIALEKHVEDPEKSEIIESFPSFMRNHHALDFFSDTMKVVIMGGVNIYDLSDLMDLDLEVQHEESLQPSAVYSTVGDAMPGFGIVAAVLGVVITMQSIGGPPEEVGEKVGAALVGTFVGVLLAYGIFGPLAKATETIAKAEGQYLNCIKNGVVAFARGDSPLICIEFARRNIDPAFRPSFKEAEDACKGRGKSSSGGGSAEMPKAA
jgi:chemotaxis protein MotA